MNTFGTRWVVLKKSSSDRAVYVRHWYTHTVCGLTKWIVSLMALEPIRKRVVRFYVSQWGWLQRIFGSWWKIFCDANPSNWYIPVRNRTEMCHCSHVVVTRLDVAGLVMGLWMTAGPLIVSSALPWPPMSLFERHTYSNMVSWQWKISHKGQMIQLICGDDSVQTEENDIHFNLLSKFQLYMKRKFKQCHGKYFSM